MGKKRNRQKENRNKAIKLQRLKALVRDPQFLKDREKVIRNSEFPANSKEINELLKKYNIVGYKIPSPKYVENLEKRFLSHTREVFFDDEPTIARAMPLSQFCFPDSCVYIDTEKKQMVDEICKNLKEMDNEEDEIDSIDETDKQDELAGKKTIDEIMKSKDFGDCYLKDRRYLAIKIDMHANKNDVKDKIEEEYDFFAQFVDKPKSRIMQSREVDMFDVWDKFKESHSLVDVAIKLKANQSTVKSAYYRAFKMIMGEDYDLNKHNRKSLTKEQLSITCDKCPKNPDTGGNCDTLCPSVFYYVDQDKKSAFSVRDVSILEKTLKDESLEARPDSLADTEELRRNLLPLIEKVTGRKFSSAKDALVNLSEEEKQILRRDSRLKSFI